METESKDPVLWKAAQKRAGFKYHLLIYFIMNIFFWTLWYIGFRNDNILSAERGIFPWPLWPMFIWGIGVLYNYLNAYKSHNGFAEREYQKLKFNQQ